MPRLTTRIRYGLARLLKGGSFSIVPPWVVTSILNPAYHSLVREGYQKSSAFFACVSALAFSFPEPPLRIYDGDGEDAQALDDHSLRRLIRKPMPNMSEAELMATTMVYLGIGGNAFWHKVRNQAGQVIQLRPYGAGHITPVPGGENWIRGYSYDPYGNGVQSALDGEELIPPEDIVHFKWPSVDPTQPWMSQPPILAAAVDVDSDIEVRRFAYALLRNDAIPRTVITIPGDRPLDDEEFRRTKQQWRERYGGDNRGDVAILEGGATVSRLGLDLQELAFDGLAKIPETRIAAAMRVPPIVAGLNVGLDRSTYSNYGEARQAFTRDTLVPLWRLVASEIEADLLLGEPQFQRERGVTARYDLNRVVALQEDANGKWKRTTDAYKAGLLTKNEGRRTLGYSDVPDGDVFYLVPTRPAASEPSKSLTAPGGTKSATANLESIEEDMRNAVQSYLAEQYELAADAVADQAVVDQAKAGDILDAELVEQIGLDLGTTIQRIMRRFYPRTIRQAFNDASAALDIDLAWNISNERVQTLINDLVTLVVRITETTRQQIRDLISRQAAEGWSIPQLAKAIRDLGGIESRKRALMIARTETALAYSRGSLLAYMESGVVKRVEWVATNDQQTCPDCAALHGTKAQLGEAFGDGTLTPPRHPNCRCTIIPRID